MKVLTITIFTVGAMTIAASCNTNAEYYEMRGSLPYTAMTPGTSAQSAAMPDDSVTGLTVRNEAQKSQEMPASVRRFLNRYYKNIGVVKYKTKTTVGKGKQYEIELENGVETEFDNSGNWTEIKDYKGVPASLVPRKISSYVSQKYPDIKIKSIEKETRKKKIEVELLDGTDLEFDLAGNFLRID